jgi:hypothetical protein
MSFHVRPMKEPAAFCAWYGAEARRLSGGCVYSRDHTQHKFETTIQDDLHRDSISMGRCSFFEYHIMGLPPPLIFKTALPEIPRISRFGAEPRRLPHDRAPNSNNKRLGPTIPCDWPVLLMRMRIDISI